MANRIFIQDYNRQKSPMDFPLLDDPTLEAVSQFGSFSDVIPKAAEILDTVTLASSGSSGQVSAGVLSTKNLFDIPRWKKTEPVKFVAKLIFDLKKDPDNDIFYPIQQIMSYSILTSNSDGSYSVPGISLASVSAFQSSGGQNGLAKNAKVVSVGVPGIIHLPVAIIERVSPTFSKEITEAGFPLWATADVTVSGVFPANTKNFDDARILARSHSMLPGL
jgi:hypothetical protein